MKLEITITLTERFVEIASTTATFEATTIKGETISDLSTASADDIKATLKAHLEKLSQTEAKQGSEEQA